MEIYVLVFFCAIIALYDLKTMRIPDIFLTVFSITMIIVDKNIFNGQFVFRLVSLAISFLIFGCVWIFTHGIGFGDVKYASVLGFFLGLENLAAAFLFSSCLGFCVYLLGIYVSKLPKSTKIPFAPFLSAGAILAVSLKS